MFKNQPAGLYVLSLANMGERFGYYTMLAIFLLFLQAKFGFDAAVSGQIYAIFLALVYFMPLIGGWVADKWSFSKCVVTGICIMFVGYLIMAIPTEIRSTSSLIVLCAALALIAVGTGLFKGNLQVMVGDLYNELLKQPEPEAARIAAALELYVSGSLNVFNHRTNVELSNRLVCFDISLTSPQLTAAWENNLTQIAKGNADPAAFMQGIEAMAQELVKTYASVLGEKQELFKTEKTEIGKCPRCKSPVYEGKKNYYCSNKECGFTMWKNDRFFEERKTVFTRSIAAALLKSGKVKVKKLYSPKTGKTYDGTVLLADTGGKYVNYKVTISKDKELE